MSAQVERTTFDAWVASKGDAVGAPRREVGVAPIMDCLFNLKRFFFLNHRIGNRDVLEILNDGHRRKRPLRRAKSEI